MEKVSIHLCDRIINSINDKYYHDIQSSHDVIYNIPDILLESGKIYGICCKCGEGGQGITNLLTGDDYITEEKIYIGDRLYKPGEKVNEGWTMGKGIKNLFVYHSTVEQQIKYALRKSKKNMSLNDIVEKFDLTPERLYSKIYQLSGERWRASAAIGYAYGKQIYCFPWLDFLTLKEVIIMSSGYVLYAQILRDSGGIVIIPAEDKKMLEYITDEVIELNNPRFHDMGRLMQYLHYKNFLGKFDG